MGQAAATATLAWRMEAGATRPGDRKTRRAPEVSGAARGPVPPVVVKGAESGRPVMEAIAVEREGQGPAQPACPERPGVAARVGLEGQGLAQPAWLEGPGAKGRAAPGARAQLVPRRKRFVEGRGLDGGAAGFDTR